MVGAKQGEAWKFGKGFTAGYLADRFGKRKKAVKECLLDQSIIAGIGSIYSDEILYAAGIYPARPADSLEQKDWERLAAVIPERLSYFIEMNKMMPEEYLETVKHKAPMSFLYPPSHFT